MRIDFSRCQAFMSKQLFHRLQLRMMVQHRSREGMPQHMRAFLLQRYNFAKLLFTNK